MISFPALCPWQFVTAFAYFPSRNFSQSAYRLKNLLVLYSLWCVDTRLWYPLCFCYEMCFLYLILSMCCPLTSVWALETQSSYSILWFPHE